MPKILKDNDDNYYETNFDKEFKCNKENYREIIVKEIILIIILIEILIFKQYLFSKEKKVVIN